MSLLSNINSELNSVSCVMLSISGVTSTRPADIERDIRPMAVRYLGERSGDAYVASVAPKLNEVRITMRPERWLSQDYTKIVTKPPPA